MVVFLLPFFKFQTDLFIKYLFIVIDINTRLVSWLIHLFQVNNNGTRMTQTDATLATLENIYLFKMNNRNTKKRCEICSTLTMKTPERRHWPRSGVFIVNFEHILHLFLMFLLLIWTSKCLLGIVDFEKTYSVQHSAQHFIKRFYSLLGACSCFLDKELTTILLTSDTQNGITNWYTY